MKRQRNNLVQQRFGNFDVFIKDKITNPVNLSAVFRKLEAVLSDSVLRMIDVIYIGDFPFLKEKKVNASYMDGAIYLSNDQDNDYDMLDDIVHECAHAVENSNSYDLYSDGKIENEFLSKRNKLEIYLKHEGYPVDEYNFQNAQYDSNLDSFFMHEVGYEKLRNLSNGIFLSAYSAVSLREYFAIGFEEYYLRDKDIVRKTCPRVFEKLTLVNNDRLGEYSEDL